MILNALIDIVSNEIWQVWWISICMLTIITHYSSCSLCQVRYTHALGYFYTGNNQGVITIQVIDSSSSSTSIQMGNVTVRNAPQPFSAASTGSTFSFQVSGQKE